MYCVFRAHCDNVHDHYEGTALNEENNKETEPSSGESVELQGVWN